ncbi:MAG: hypothetical protein ACRD1R_04180 [Acidobacteriota bacterium]
MRRRLLGPLLLLAGMACSDAQDQEPFGELSRLALGRTDKAMDVHGFTELYEHLFYPLKDDSIRICEIGVAYGGSLTMWRDYFPKAEVYGIDIFDFDLSHLDTARIHTFIADQADRDDLRSFIEAHGREGFDIILDDGGHRMDQQQVSLGYLFKSVKPGGYYVIEDVHTSLADRYKDFGVSEDSTDTTLIMINEFLRSGQIKSQYLSAEENRYLMDQIEYCLLFVRNSLAHSMAAVFKKKQPAETSAGK